MKTGRLRRLNFGFYLGLSCLAVTFDAFSIINSVPTITAIMFNHDTSLPMITRYGVNATHNQMTSTANLDQPVGINGRLIVAVCGTYPEGVGTSYTILGNTNIVIDNPSMTWRRTSERFIQKIGTYGISGNYNAKNYYTPDICGGFGVTSEKISVTLNTNPKWIPGTSCRRVAIPPALKCGTNLNKTAINFRSLSTGSVVSSRKILI